MIEVRSMACVKRACGADRLGDNEKETFGTIRGAMMDIKQFKQTQFMQAKIAHNNFVLLQAPNYVTKALSTWMKELADDTESPFAENVNVEDAVNVGLVNVRNKN